jgi:DNA-binding NarL/FixJ family response regulator
LVVLQAGDIDLVVTDLRLRDMNALDSLREARQRTLVPPFIVITGKGDEEAAVAALKLGASDYIVKRENYLTQLPYAIENAISRAQLIHVNERLQTELRERERAEARVRQLNTRLEERVVQRTRELEAAHQELEETTILELIAQNAPLTEICGRLASLLALRTNAFVSINTFSPADRLRTYRRKRRGISGYRRMVSQCGGCASRQRCITPQVCRYAVSPLNPCISSMTSLRSQIMHMRLNCPRRFSSVRTWRKMMMTSALH